MKFLKSTLTSFISNMFSMFVAFLTIIVTARILGPGGNGVWGVANTIIGTAVLAFGFGIPAANVVYIGRDKKNINSVIGINFIVMIIAGACSLATYFINSKYHFSAFKGLDDIDLIIVMLTVPVFIIKTSLYNILLGIEEVTSFNKITMLDKTVTFILLVIFIVIFQSAKWIIVSNFIAVCIMTCRICWILFAKKGYRISFDMSILKGMTKYGFKAQIANAIQFINYRLDIFVCNTYLTTSAVGIYSKAAQLGETMWKVSGSVGTVVLPYTANSKQNISAFINKVIRVTFAFVLCCAIALTIISKPLILLVLGPKFAGSVIPFMLIIPGICIFSINNIIGNYFLGAGMINKNIIASAVASVLTIILDFTLIPLYGINGAAITSSISYIAGTLISLYFYKQHTGSPLTDILILKKSDVNEIKTKLSKFKKA